MSIIAFVLACWILWTLPLAAQPPSVALSRFLEIADCDDVAYGPSGDLFLACHSPYDELPYRRESPEKTADVMDGYVLRLDAETGKLVYATRFGGSQYDGAWRIRVDRQGFAYAVGLTGSRDFPTTPDALQKEYGGGESDAFLVKVAPDGVIVYATFLGGTAADQGNGLELDDEGGVLVAGTTWSMDFPGQARPRPAVDGDAFVSYFRPGQANTLRSLVFGGAKEEKLTGIVSDRRGGLFAVGYTKSDDFPTLRPVKAQLGGVSDLFLTRLAVPSLTLSFSTFFGGSGDDSGWGVVVDSEGNPIVAGTTNSEYLPAAPDAFQIKIRGKTDAFVARFQGKGYRQVRATYFGGSDDDSAGYDGQNIATDRSGSVWLVGMTNSRDLPTKDARQPEYGGEMDGFIAVFSSDLTKLCYGTHVGGPHRDVLEGITLSAEGKVLITGVTLARASSPEEGEGSDEGEPARIVVSQYRAHTRVLELSAPKACQ